MTHQLLEIINREYESSHYVTSQYKEAKRQFRSALKRLFKDDEILMYSCPHFEFSGFIRRGERYVYFATGDLRWKICNSMLIRTAKSDTDYTGGQNNSIMYNMSRSMFATMLILRVDYLFSIEVN